MRVLWMEHVKKIGSIALAAGVIRQDEALLPGLVVFLNRTPAFPNPEIDGDNVNEHQPLSELCLHLHPSLLFQQKELRNLGIVLTY